MGGQIGAEDALHLDMRRFNKVLDFAPAQKTITVQSGATWRQVQEVIDRADLSVRIMQSYADFTVGGSLSVNGHGRYVGAGPLINGVKSFGIVLADGSLVDASPTTSAEIFHGAIGGYGALGVIVDATIELTENVKVQRQSELMPIAAYRKYFNDRTAGRDLPVFHSANIFPDDYTQVRAVTYSRTAAPVTSSDRLVRAGQAYRWQRLAFWIVTEWPFGSLIQRHLADPVYFAGEPVTYRNYEASRDAAELEPASRRRSTYLLQEYFVPVERFDEFVPHMRRIFREHDVNVVNVSIRHATRDPGSLLAWAKTDVFAFVLYYKQETGTEANARRSGGPAS